GCEEITSFAINFSGSVHAGPANSAETLEAHGDAPFARRLFRGRVARPGLVVGRYQPLADGGADVPAHPTMPRFCSRFRRRRRGDLKLKSARLRLLPEDGAGAVPEDRPLAPGLTLFPLLHLRLPASSSRLPRRPC